MCKGRIVFPSKISILIIIISLNEKCHLNYHSYRNKYKSLLSKSSFHGHGELFDITVSFLLSWSFLFRFETSRRVSRVRQ